MNDKKTFLVVSLLVIAAIFVTISGIEDLRDEVDRRQVEEYKQAERLKMIDRRLSDIENILLSYEDGIRAIEVIIEGNEGYYMYQDLGLVVMSKEKYISLGGKK